MHTQNIKFQTKFLLLALALFAFSIQSNQGFSTGINSVVTNLGDYLTPSGGFSPSRDAEPSMEATSDALFIAAMFGLKDRISPEAVSAFIETLHNSDHGYSNQLGQASDLESVRNAILVSSHMNIPLGESVDQYILSLFDADSKLFANVVGGTGDFKSTALALQALEQLGVLRNKDVAEKLVAIRKNLQPLIKSDKRTKYISSITADNYYAIVAATISGLELTDLQSWANYFLDQQATQGQWAGGFFSDRERTDITVEDTAASMAALYLLQKLSKTQNFVDSVNSAALYSFSQSLTRNLKLAAQAFASLARTKSFQNIFRIQPTYEVSNNRHRVTGERIVQGTQIKPTLTIKTASGMPVSNLDVTVKITHSSGPKVEKLIWSDDTQIYAAPEFYETSDKLGDVKFEYTIGWQIVDLGDDVLLHLSDDKRIGYDISVKPSAQYEGKDVSLGESVGTGTEFNFDVKLSTHKQGKLTSGEYDITLSVFDSSRSLIHEQVVDARKNTSPVVNFKYTLSKSNIPSGSLDFYFTVSNDKGVHTSETLSYSHSVTMIATNIKFEGAEGNETPTYKIGDNIKVTIEPATLPDLRTVQALAVEDVKGKPVQRHFRMIVKSPKTGELFSIPGEGTSSVTFSLAVYNTFDLIGENDISFVYVADNSEAVELKNWDSKNSELFEDSSKLGFKVNAELHVVDIKNPIRDGNLDYGNEVKLFFKIRDSVTGQLVFASSEQATVYLTLRHKELGRSTPFTSSKMPAQQIYPDNSDKPEEFQITWTVNPNAVSGDAYLELIAESADRTEIGIYKENSQDLWRVDVVIGGKIDVEKRTFSNVVNELDAIFLVEVDLSCQRKRLNDAQLKANVLYKSGKELSTVIENLPVTHSGETGHYQLSWFSPKENVKGGEYVVNFYREVDRARLADTEREAELSPFFVVELNYNPDTGSPLPIKTELLVVVLLGAAFFWTSFRKMDIEDLRRRKKNK